MSTFELIQFMLLFAVSIIFTTIALQRETFISHLISAILWIGTAVANYVLGTSFLQIALSYVFLGLGLIFTLAALKALGDSYSESKAERWQLTL